MAFSPRIASSPHHLISPHSSQTLLSQCNPPQNCFRRGRPRSRSYSFQCSMSPFVPTDSARIKVVGVGGGGNSAVNRMIGSGLQRTALFRFMKTFVLANTFMLILPVDVLAETCEADNNSLYNMPLLLGIALIGATVGGLLARQRKGELKRLNDQLRQINAALRRQAKIESYAPNLSYAPVGRIPEAEVVVDPRKQELITKLRTGKNYLRNQDLESAFTEFKAAFELAQDLGDHVEEKKAARGLGASLQRQGKFKDAIKYHSRVLEISQQVGEDSGTTEAYGAIADCYTELGDLERAGKFYDMYIARLETD